MARPVRAPARIDSGLLLVCVIASVAALVMPARSRAAIAATLRTTIFAPLVRLEAEGAAARTAIADRNMVLVARGRQVSDAVYQREVRDENTVLRGLLGLAARVHDGFVIAEVLPRPGVSNDFRLSLNVGTRAGIHVYAPVVNADGLVGMVEQADDASATAITWAHPDFRVSAMSVDEHAFGIVQPHLVGSGGRFLLEMRGVPFRAKIDSGTLVVSSGLGTTYPRGLPVGTVLGEIVTPERWARTYLIRPAVIPGAIGPVMVLRSDRVARGLQNVWATGTGADSAARATALSGDSLVRKAALDEVAARRAAMDSTVRVLPPPAPAIPPAAIRR